MYAESWVDAHRPFTWATDADVAQPNAGTMGRFIARGAAQQCVIEDVAYAWYTGMKHLVTTPIDDLGLSRDSYDKTVNATWRAMHARASTIPESRQSILDGHRGDCSAASHLTARRILAAMPPEPEEKDAPRIVHGAIVAASSYQTDATEKEIAERLDCQMFAPYNAASTQVTEAVPALALELALTATEAANTVTVPTFTMHDR